MDHVLGVVRHYDVEPDTILLLVQQHALVDPIQAIGLRRRTVVRADGEVYSRRSHFHPADRLQGAIVVGISAHEKVIILVVDRSEVVVQHALDDGMFEP